MYSSEYEVLTNEAQIPDSNGKDAQKWHRFLLSAIIGIVGLFFVSIAIVAPFPSDYENLAALLSHLSGVFVIWSILLLVTEGFLLFVVKPSKKSTAFVLSISLEVLFIASAFLLAPVFARVFIPNSIVPNSSYASDIFRKTAVFSIIPLVTAGIISALVGKKAYVWTLVIPACAVVIALTTAVYRFDLFLLILIPLIAAGILSILLGKRVSAWSAIVPGFVAVIAMILAIGGSRTIVLGMSTVEEIFGLTMGLFQPFAVLMPLTSQNETGNQRIPKAKAEAAQASPSASTAFMFCPNCGNRFPMGRKFCDRCGIALKEAVMDDDANNPISSIHKIR